MSISTVFDAVKIGLASVLVATGESPVEHELGEEHLKLGEERLPERQTKPSIVWVPRGAPKIDMTSGRRSPTSTTVQAGVSLPRQLAKRSEMISIYIWTHGFRFADKLLNHLVATMQVQLTGGSFHPVSTEWSIDAGAKDRAGTLCLFKCVIEVPFTYEPEAALKAPVAFSLEGDFVESPADFTS